MGDVWGVERGVDVTVDEQELAAARERERRRFRAQEHAVDRMRGKLLRMRWKLKLTKEKNLALSAIREEFEKERWAREASGGDCGPVGSGERASCRIVRLDY